MKKKLKAHVVAFRIPLSLGQELERTAGEMKVVNVGSGSKLARKVVLDFMAGRLAYLNAHDRMTDPVLRLGQESA